MMSIVLFALIGAKIHAGVAYWICFGVYSLFRSYKVLSDLAEKGKESKNVRTH